MNEQRLEVADVFRRHGQEFLDRWGHVLSRQQLKAFRDIGACRTAALGTHVRQCDHCAHQLIEYRSCRNRHCPKCHCRARDRWLADRAGEILPVPYAHVIFTLPHQLAPLALQNPPVVYGILFRAVAESLSEMAADPKRLGRASVSWPYCTPGTSASSTIPTSTVLCPPGDCPPTGNSGALPRRSTFFCRSNPWANSSARSSSSYLREAFAARRLEFYGQLRELAHPARFQEQLAALDRIRWVVYAKPPFGGPEQVLRYLARYTHRVAISNGRLLGLEEGRVRFRWRDSRDGNQIKEMSLDAVEFIRRFLLHVLPGDSSRSVISAFSPTGIGKPWCSIAENCCRRCRSCQPWSAPRSTLCPICKIGHMHFIPSPALRGRQVLARRPAHTGFLVDR